MKPYFEGLYFKHQKGDNTLSFIAGIAADRAFIQIINNSGSKVISFPRSEYSKGKVLRIADSSFSDYGIKINIKQCGISASGEIKYFDKTPLKYDIMGPFRFFPMQCRHKVLSLYHRTEGAIEINGEKFDFAGGVGYIEGDSGRDFPKNYSWIHCSDFPGKCSIMVSIADIPFMGFEFRGCIAAIYFEDKEYRLATYLGAKIAECSENKIIIAGGKMRLEIDIDCSIGHNLLAPADGVMTRNISERIACSARFRFFRGKKILFDYHSNNASFEYSKQ